jgi:predicted PurR-regulated permease PerM
MIIVGIVGLIIAGAGAYFAGQAIDAIAVGLNSTVDLLDDTVGTTTASLENVKATLSETNATLSTVSDATRNVATTLFDTQPLLEQVTTMTTDTLPTSLDAVNTAIPNLAGIAATIDTTLERLSDLQINRTIEAGPFSVPLNFDLGISYAPQEPFDNAVLAIGESLVPVPDQLRMLEGNLNTAVTNLGNIGNDIEALSGNITGINATVEQYIPLLDQYIVLLDQITGSLENARAQINANLSTIKWVATGLMLWFAVYQIMPLYVGYRMLSDKVVEGNIEERLEEEREEMEERVKEAEDKAEEAAERAADDAAAMSS